MQKEERVLNTLVLHTRSSFFESVYSFTIIFLYVPAFSSRRRKAKKYIENRGITTKEIPIKILAPLLENASLEENESFQDKWAKMLVNMVDTKTNLQNQIFPYLLSQISIEEYEGLTNLLTQEKLHQESYKKLNELIELNEKEKYHYTQSPEVRKIKENIDQREQEGFFINLELFEYSNLERLGLIKHLPPKIIIEEFQTGDRNMYGESMGEKWHQIDAEYDMDTNGYKLTELGEKFIEVCEIK